MKEEIKRLFFGAEVHAPWPLHLPGGRLIDESQRHLTLAFFGTIPFPPLLALLDQIPRPAFLTGLTGRFDACLALPKRHPHVIAWRAKWWEEKSPLEEYQALLSRWLSSHRYSLDDRIWLPHATICRSPFDPKEWIEAFHSLPLYTTHIHLYESVGNLNYQPIWSLPLQPPFIEIEHTADMAFLIYGSNLRELYLNAFTALAFKAPELLGYFDPKEPVASLVDIVIALNGIIGQTDGAVGCPLKAVSFHGEIIVEPNSLLRWEMIVDV